MKQIGFILYLNGFLFAATGHLSGLIRDASTHQPLIGVNVIIRDTEIGAATDIDGYFKIDNVPVGSYNINVNSISP